MRKCILLFTIATLLAASFCSSSDWDNGDSGCSLDGDSIETTREVCNKRTAAASGYDCCLLSGTVSGVKTAFCIAANKTKAGEIVDEIKKNSEEESEETTKDIKLQCESSMIKYFTLFSLLSLFLF